MKIDSGVLPSEVNLPMLPLPSSPCIAGNSGKLLPTACARFETLSPHAIMFSRSRDLFFVITALTRSGYCYGRICGVYWSTASWNIQKNKLLAALSRVLFDVSAFFRSEYIVLCLNFWEALGADQVPNTLHLVMKADEQKLNYTLEWNQQDGNYDR